MSPITGYEVLKIKMYLVDFYLFKIHYVLTCSSEFSILSIDFFFLSYKCNSTGKTEQRKRRGSVVEERSMKILKPQTIKRASILDFLYKWGRTLIS